MSFASDVFQEAIENQDVPKADIDSIYEASNSLVAFRNRFLASSTDVSPADFHELWSNELLHGKDNVAVQAFREAAKDQYVFQANILHALTYPVFERSYIVIIAANKTQASQKLKDITRQFQAPNNALLRWNVSKVIEDSGDAFQVQYLDGSQVRIEAYGKGAAVRGIVWGAKRPDMIILNDIQAVEDMDSEVTLERDWKWFLSDIRFLGNSSRIFMIGNNMGPNCVIEKVFANKNELNFRCMRIPMIKADGEASWPARFPKDFCEAEREAYEKMGELDIWERERMCKPMAEASHPLKWEQVKFYEETEIDLSDFNIITITDPGISLKSSADPTVIATVGINKDNDWYVLDVDRKRRNPSDQIDDIFNAVSIWRPTAVGIETVAYQEALAFMVEEEQRKRNIFFNVTRIKTHLEKVSKIRNRLQPRLRAGMIYLPKHASWLKDIKREIEAFPVGEHDDIIDAISMIEDARANLLVPQFSSSRNLFVETPIPTHWPLWTSLVADPDGEASLLLSTCSPEGQLIVLDQIFAKMTPEELYAEYKNMVGTRRIINTQAPLAMFREKHKNGQTRAKAYRQAGFRLVENDTDYQTVLPTLSSYFNTPKGTRPKLVISAKCKRLLWELYNALEGEVKDPQRKSIQALLLWIGMGPRWRDMTNEKLISGRDIQYPAPDVP